MRDLIDHERAMMLDLTGTSRPVPQIGETLRVDPAADMPAWPDVPGGADDPIPFGEGGPRRAARGDFGVGRSEVHAGAGTAARMASGCGREASGGDGGVDSGTGSGNKESPPTRPVTGFLALLTPEQRVAALAYDGPQDFGRDEFRIDPTAAAMRAGFRAHIVMDGATADALMLAAKVYVHALWDHAVALAAEDGPVPLIGAEAWEEGNQAYAKRLGVPPHIYLDRDGVARGLPRARLVRGPDRIADLDRVEVLVLVENDRGTSVPAGAQGTVVGIWSDGAAFEVEFWNGVDEYGYSIATVAAEGLRLVPVEAT